MKKPVLADLLRNPAWVVLICIAVYAALLGWACHAKFSNYGYDDFDLAIDAQSIWNILHGSVASSIHGIPFLGNHMRLILFLIAPLYALFPSPLLLLHLQTLVLGFGAWGIYLLAKRELPGKWAAWLSLVYLVYPPLIYLNLYEFHPIALAGPFIIGMLYSYKTQHFRWFLLFLLLALSCQENVSLIAMAFSFYVLLDGRRGRWFYTPLAAGIIHFGLAVFVIMPLLNNNTIQFVKLYGHLGSSLPEVFSKIILHPVYTLRCMFSAEKLAFLNALVGPVAYLSLLSPLSLLPAALVAVQRLLSMRASEATIVYHYQAEFIPFVFFAAIYGIKRLMNLKYRIAKPALGMVLVLFPLSAVIAGGILPALGEALSAPRNNSFIRARKNCIVRGLPGDASVLATFDFLPRLTNLRHLYSFHHVYTGHYTLSDVAYPTPDVDYIIMDTSDLLTFSTKGFYGPGNYRRLQAILNSPSWEVIEHVNSLLVFRRSPSGTGAGPLSLVEYLDAEPGMNRNVDQPPGAAVRLLGFETGAPDNDNAVPLTLYWEKTRDSAEDYDMQLTITGKSMLYRGVLSPGSRIWPPQSWPVGKLIADRHHVHLDTCGTSSGDIRLRVKLLLLN